MKFLRTPAFFAAALAICLVAVSPAKAAEITRQVHANGADIISLNGLIERDDDMKFISIARGIDHATVVLSSIGGFNNAAANIGRFIRLHNYETAVHNGAMCNSSCVLIWIAGRYRHLDRRARLGLHSAITETGERHKEANEKIAIYMKEMGAPQPMIDLQPKADPCCINWVDYPQAKAWGLLDRPEDPEAARAEASVAAPPPQPVEKWEASFRQCHIRKWFSKDELAAIGWARETEGQTIVIEAEEIATPNRYRGAAPGNRGSARSDSRCRLSGADASCQYLRC